MKPVTDDTAVGVGDRRAHVAGALAASVVVHLVAFGLPVLLLCSDSRDIPYKPKLVAHRGEVAVVVQRVPAVVPSAPKVEAARPKPREAGRSESNVPVHSRRETKLIPHPDRERPRPVSRTIASVPLRRKRVPELRRESARRMPREESPLRTPRTFERRVVPSEPIVLDAGVTSVRLLDGVGTPRYPAECVAGKHRRGGCEGRGEYAFVVDERGRVVSVKIVTSAGCAHLDLAAVLFFRQRARFEIVEKGGEPVGWSGTRKVDFFFKGRR